MLVTVMADASYCPDTGISGYGCWIASDRGTKGTGGAMRQPCRTSTEAEMQAVVNAIHIGKLSKLIDTGDKLLIQIDCMQAIMIFSNLHRTDAQQAVVKEVFKKMCKESELEVSFRHVKAHTKGEDQRRKANNHCDRRARAAMRKARDKFLQEQPQDEDLHSGTVQPSAGSECPGTAAEEARP